MSFLFFNSKRTNDTEEITQDVLNLASNQSAEAVYNKALAECLMKIKKDTFCVQSVKTCTRAERLAKRVLEFGIRKYRIGGKKAKILTDFFKSCAEMVRIRFELRIRMIPTMAEEIVLEWAAETEKKLNSEKGERRRNQKRLM
ncbi:hypothetical protein CRE_14798 [Caenorhabditis remanei]|uniref:Uncharacterized protein n=1 Tax=Caenorhabditis remanei TaxID=31234 RepID=E3MRT0_CAERE|nr:hypothetical protein CRE_14798 [Caenorhabditis remanei]